MPQGVINKICAQFKGHHNYYYYLRGHSQGTANAGKVQVNGDIADLQHLLTATKCKLVLKVQPTFFSNDNNNNMYTLMKR